MGVLTVAQPTIDLKTIIRQLIEQDVNAEAASRAIEDFFLQHPERAAELARLALIHQREAYYGRHVTLREVPMSQIGDYRLPTAAERIPKGEVVAISSAGEVFTDLPTMEDTGLQMCHGRTMEEADIGQPVKVTQTLMRYPWGTEEWLVWVITDETR
jgi:hypothetical protein